MGIDVTLFEVITQIENWLSTFSGIVAAVVAGTAVVVLIDALRAD